MKVGLIISLCLLPLYSFAFDVKAPLGFTWGETKEQLEEKGAIFDDCYVVKIMTCNIVKPLESISFADVSIAFFDDSNTLVQVGLSKTIRSDNNGLKGIQLYEQLKGSLVKSYGKPVQHLTIGADRYFRADEFYECLTLKSCGVYESFWVGRGEVVLEIKGINKGLGQVNLFYLSEFYR